MFQCQAVKSLNMKTVDSVEYFDFGYIRVLLYVVLNIMYLRQTLLELTGVISLVSAYKMCIPKCSSVEISSNIRKFI